MYDVFVGVVVKVWMDVVYDLERGWYIVELFGYVFVYMLYGVVVVGVDVRVLMYYVFVW